MKRVYIIHGWGGSPNEPMIAWLGQEAKKHGFEAHVLEMPHTDKPTIDDWVNHLAEKVGKVNMHTYFIGHSIGCQTIMRYLASQPVVCGGAIFIAGWFGLQGLETAEEERIASPWLETPIDFDKLKQVMPYSAALFSDNDPFVPLSDKDIFKIKLGSITRVEHDKGHFTYETKIDSAPWAIEQLVNFAKR